MVIAEMWKIVLVFCLFQVRGEVNLPTEAEPTLRQYPPQTFRLKATVTSNPIVLVDKKTLFIPAFYYKGGYKNVRFWVGNGTEPDSNGIPIPDEEGLLNNLHPYHGQSIELHLPDGVTTDNVDYFGVWSLDKKTSLGHVVLTGISGVPEPQSTSSDKFRVPKCCVVDSVITSQGCQIASPKGFTPNFSVYKHNETHFNNVSMNLSTINYEPYVYSVECPSGKYFLVQSPPEEEFGLLQNGSLLVRSMIKAGIFSQRDFCMDTVENETEMRIFVCAPVHEIQQGMFVAYVALTIISTLCFAGTFFLYFFWLRIEDVHRKYFTAYVAAMTFTFLFLIIVQLAYVEDAGCRVLGFLFQFAMITSFTLLAILCFDIYFVVRNIDRTAWEDLRIRWYLGVALAVPILSLVISLARNQTPDVPNSFFKPQYHKNSCYFAEDKQRSIFFYLPIVASIVVGVVFLFLTRIKIVHYENSKKNDAIWIDNRKNYKFMFRQCLLTWVIMTICWIADMLMNVVDESSGILNAALIFGSLQGVLIAGVFTMHHYRYSRSSQNESSQHTSQELARLNSIHSSE